MDFLVRSWQDLGTILTKILSRSRHDIHFALVRSRQAYVQEKFYWEPNVAICHELFDFVKKKQCQKNMKLKTIENLKHILNYKITGQSLQPLE